MTNQLVGAPNTVSGGSVLTALRGDLSRRPAVDPGLSGGLRDWLEDGLCGLAPSSGVPMIVTKKVISRAHTGRRHREERTELTTALAIGVVIDTLFRQLVTVGYIDDPVEDGLGALGVDPRQADVVDYVQNLQDHERLDFEDEVETQTAIMASKWPRLSAGWLPRTQERIAIPLAGGAVVLVGIIDLVVGTPSTGSASVGLVDVKSGRPRMDDREDLRFYALLETLRSGAPPFRTATFYTRTGHVDTEDVDDQILTNAVQRVLSTVQRMEDAA